MCWSAREGKYSAWCAHLMTDIQRIETGLKSNWTGLPDLTRKFTKPIYSKDLEWTSLITGGEVKLCGNLFVTKRW